MSVHFFSSPFAKLLGAIPFYLPCWYFTPEPPLERSPCVPPPWYINHFGYIATAAGEITVLATRNQSKRPDPLFTRLYSPDVNHLIEIIVAKTLAPVSQCERVVFRKKFQHQGVKKVQCPLLPTHPAFIHPVATSVSSIESQSSAINSMAFCSQSKADIDS